MVYRGTYIKVDFKPHPHLYKGGINMGDKYFSRLLKDNIKEIYISDVNTCIPANKDIIDWAAHQVLLGSIKLEQLSLEDGYLIINI